LVALGDSVTLGVRSDKSVRAHQTFAALLEKRLQEKVVNAGVGGNNSAQMLERLDRDVLARKPRVVLLMAGLNDAAYVDPGPVARDEPRVPVDEYEKNLTAIVRRVRRDFGKVVILTPNPMTRKYRYQDFPFYQQNDINDGVAPYAEVARRVARQTNSCLVDVFAEWVRQREHRNWLPDGIHPNPEGHRRIADQAMAACRSVLWLGRAKPPAAARATSASRSKPATRKPRK
jgi:lysophospholipase L1-like esterase